MIRPLLYGLSVLLVAWGALAVPMPVVEFSPGGSFDVEPLVEVTAEVETTPINGDLELLTVRVDQPSIAETVRAWLSPTRDLREQETVIPQGMTRREYLELQRRTFQRSFDVAVAVGLRLAGEDVTVRTGAVVVFALEGGPADGQLRPGDVILEVAGTAVTTAEELIAIGQQTFRAGEPVELTVLRADEQLTVELTPEEMPQLERPVIGVQLGTIAYDVELPFEVRLAPTTIGGPSAGLMIALTVFDLLAEEDLAAGRVIAGTGTIDEAGRVGPIGGVAEKVIAAHRTGASVMLAPAAQAQEALAAAEGRPIEVIPVATVQEAVDALRRTAAPSA